MKNNDLRVWIGVGYVIIGIVAIIQSSYMLANMKVFPDIAQIGMSFVGVFFFCGGILILVLKEGDKDEIW